MQRVKNFKGEKMSIKLSKIFYVAVVFVFIFLAVNTKVSADSKLPCNDKILVSLQKILKTKDVKTLSLHIADVVVFNDYTEEPVKTNKFTKKQIITALKDKKDNDLKWFFFKDLYIEKDEMENSINVNENSACNITNEALRFEVKLELTAKNWIITQKDQH